MRPLADLDHFIFEWIAKKTSNRNEVNTMRLFKWVSKTGDGHLYFVLAGALFYADQEYGALFFFTALLAYSLELPIYVALKHLFKRRRPCDLLQQFKAGVVPSDKFSLPSGHTAAAFLMATVIAHFYPSIGIFAYLWAALVGLSRVVLRVHFPLDVLIGMGLGVSFAYVSLYILG